MIYSKMWCVVKPSVGIPIFIAAVAISSFSVHLALTMNTTWVKAYLNGGASKVAMAPAPAAAIAAPPEAPAPKK